MLCVTGHNVDYLSKFSNNVFKNDATQYAREKLLLFFCGKRLSHSPLGQC